ncbi:hypothetical protein KFK09_022741 [Dendrobium nobile]|uniref:Uncharacterized protein n=1 Tax=Dendrobium nobile TaxID=94219 RepID=A0A8T3AQR1_DENNO|nr:hypothetical protein KFK09_022741 [Dendrobium nobile]
MALKANNTNTDSSGYENDNVVFITRQFKSFLRKKQKDHQKWKRGKDSKKYKSSSDVVCFECRKSGHVKTSFPTLKEHPNMENCEEKPKYMKDKKRSQKTFWADSTSNSSETEAEEETTNLCLMADNQYEQSDQEEVSSHQRPCESISYLDNGDSWLIIA